MDFRGLSKPTLKQQTHPDPNCQFLKRTRIHDSFSATVQHTHTTTHARNQNGLTKYVSSEWASCSSSGPRATGSMAKKRPSTAWCNAASPRSILRSLAQPFPHLMIHPPAHSTSHHPNTARIERKNTTIQRTHIKSERPPSTQIPVQTTDGAQPVSKIRIFYGNTLENTQNQQISWFPGKTRAE